MSALLSFIREPHASYKPNLKAQKTRELPRSVSLLARRLHERGLANANMMKQGESNLLDDLREMDDAKTYGEFECTSLYSYAVDWLGLTQAVALNLIQIMRRAKKVPELIEAIKDGRISTSAARKIAPVINEANKAAWLELASTLSVAAIEKAVATASPKHAVQESVRYITGERLELKLGISEEFRDTLKTLKDIFSQKSQRAVDTEEALFLAMKEAITRHSPIEKAKRAEARKLKPKLKSKREPASPCTDTPADVVDGVRHGPVSSETATKTQESNCRILNRGFNARRKPICAEIKHAVNLRDQNRCTEKNSEGQRCTERRWLDVHHIREVANGGNNSPENLRTVCRSHHRELHARPDSHVT